MNLFKDGPEGKWARLEVGGQPEMSSAGFEKVQEVVGRGSRLTKEDITYDDGSAMAKSTRSPLSQDRGHDDGRYGRRSRSGNNQIKDESTADDGHYSVYVGNTRVYHEERSGDHDSGYGSNLGQDDRAGYGKSTGYSNST